MSEQALVGTVVEYAVNAVWQLPLLLGGAGLLVRVMRMSARAEHRLWVGVLVGAVVLPACGMRGTAGVPASGLRSSVPAETSPATAATHASQERATWSVDGAKRLESTSASPGGGTRLSEGSRIVSIHRSVADFPTRASRGWSAQGLASASVPALPERWWHVRLAALRLPWWGMRVGAWAVAGAALLSLVRLAGGWLATRGLISRSKTWVLDEAEAAMWLGIAERMGVAMPEVRVSEEMSGPVVVGLLRPLLLLPGAFSQRSEQERRAAICHELAHVARRDCLAHVLCRVVAVPLAWHPVMGWVMWRVGRTREMVCDEMAAAEMRSGIAYARCLVSLAREMMAAESGLAAAQALGLFQSGRLEERVMRLTRRKETAGMREQWMRRMTGVAAAGLTLAGVAIVHVSPVRGQKVAGSAAVSAAPETSAMAALPAPAPPAPPMPGVSLRGAGSAVTSPRRVLPDREEVPRSPAVARVPVVEALIDGVQSAAVPQAPSAPAAPPVPPAPRSGPGTDIDVFTDNHGSIAHGFGAHSIVGGGQYVHRWMGADGKPFEMTSDQPGELTEEQQKAAEADFARRMEKLNAQVAYLRSPEYHEQLRKLASESGREAMRKAQQQMRQQLRTVDTPEWKVEMEQANRLAIEAQMQQLDTQRAVLQNKDLGIGLDGVQRGDTAELEARVAAAERRLDEASKRLDEARKSLEAAQQRIEKDKAAGQ